MPLITGVFVLVFGGLTLWLQDDHFIKIKPTIVNGLFAAILFGGLLSGRLFLKIVFGDVMHLSEEGWRVLTLRWALFFVFLAFLNELVWRSFSTDTWVTFKVFGIMPITFVFALAQIGLLKKHEISTSGQGINVTSARTQLWAVALAGPLHEPLLFRWTKCRLACFLAEEKL